MKEAYVEALGNITDKSGFYEITQCSDGYYTSGKDGVKWILSTGDGKVEFICLENRTLAYVKSGMGYPAYYPVLPVREEKPVKAVLMDLDGTTVKSEEFWIWIIEKTIQSLLGNRQFQLENCDIPYVSGHSVSEHLQYCIQKYCPNKKIEEARAYYFQHTNEEMKEIMEGRGRKDAFTPTEGVKDFLLELKQRQIKIGLVTSGLYEKAYPEILSAFKSMQMGEPTDFFDCIITAGFPLQKGKAGTMGELEAKPHPWLYAETATVGLGIPFTERNHVVGIEDSGAGVCAIRLGGFSTIGIAGGNIESSGTRGVCNHYCHNFEEIIKII